MSKVGDVWRYWRPVYKYTWALWQKSSYKHYVNYLASLNSADIIDVGSGTGEYLRFLRLTPGVKLMLTDPDEQSLKLAIRNAEHLNDSVDHRCCGVDDILKSCGSPDLISYVHVLSVLDDPERYISESKDVLAENGVILVYLSKFNGVSFLNAISEYLGFKQLKVCKVLAGFDRISVGALNYCYIYRG